MPDFPARQGRPAGDRARTTFVFLALALMIGWLLVNLKFIFLPLFLAFFSAFLLIPSVEGLRRLGAPRLLATIVVLLGTTVLAWLGSRYVLASFLAFRDGLPKYEASLALLVGQARHLTDNFPFLTVDLLHSSISGISLAGVVGETINSFFNVLGYTLATLIFLWYFLTTYQSFPRKLLQAFPDQRGPILCRAFEGIGRQVQGYVLAKMASSLVNGLAVALTCMFFGLDFAVTWGVFGAALNFVPNIGTILTILPPAAVALVQPDLDGLSTALGLSASLALVRFLIVYVLEPRIMENNVDLSPIASLLALFFWGWLWGTAGLVIAVPAMVVVKFTCDNIESLRPIGVLLTGPGRSPSPVKAPAAPKSAGP